jgi:hypothetical protein
MHVGARLRTTAGEASWGLVHCCAWRGSVRPAGYDPAETRQHQTNRVLHVRIDAPGLLIDSDDPVSGVLVTIGSPR